MSYTFQVPGKTLGLDIQICQHPLFLTLGHSPNDDRSVFKDEDIWDPFFVPILILSIARIVLGSATILPLPPRWSSIQCRRFRREPRHPFCQVLSPPLMNLAIVQFLRFSLESLRGVVSVVRVIRVGQTTSFLVLMMLLCLQELLALVDTLGMMVPLADGDFVRILTLSGALAQIQEVGFGDRFPIVPIGAFRTEHRRGI